MGKGTYRRESMGWGKQERQDNERAGKRTRRQALQDEALAEEERNKITYTEHKERHRHR
jgi:hypothetical protein